MSTTHPGDAERYGRMHEAQLSVETSTVRSLLADQFPRWADATLTPLPLSGTVNAVFRLGASHTVRLPLVVNDVTASARAVRAEADASCELAARLTVPVPVVQAIGAPGRGYPGFWSVTNWIDGEPATPDGSLSDAVLAGELARAVRQVRSIPAGGRTFTGAARGGLRGGELRDHDEWVETCLRESAGLLDVPALRAAWERLRTLPRRDPDAMTHGDLIPSNLLLRDGRFAGVLDVATFGPADPALDLIPGWHLFEEPARSEFRESLGADGLAWARGAAWAFIQAIGLVWYYRESNPGLAALGRSTLDRILASGIPARPARSPFS